MSDQYEVKQKKSIGCLGVFLIVLLVLALIGGSIYIFLPKIISSSLNGGAASVFLPQGVKDGAESVKLVINENIDQLERFGLTPKETIDIVSSIEYETVEKILERMEETPVSNTNELIEIVSEYIDISAADLDKIKKEYNINFEGGNLQEISYRFKNNPRIMKTGFKVIKQTIIDSLKAAEEQ